MANDSDSHVIPVQQWSDYGPQYNDVIGTTTLHGTTRLIDIIHGKAPFNNDSRVLDVGAGSGSLTIKVQEKSSEANILAVDIAEGMLRLVDGLHLPNVTTRQEDALTLASLPDDHFSHGLSSFVIQFTPDAAACIASLHRVLKPGGIVGIAVWGPYLQICEIHDQACKRLRSDYKPAEFNVANSWSDEASHRRALQEAGFIDVDTELVKMKLECGGADGACDFWFRSTNPVAGKLVGDWIAHGGSKEELEREVRALAEEVYNKGEVIWMDAVLGWGRVA